MKCPSFERLIDYLDNRLTVAEAARVSAHLAAGCRDCAENREWYERMRSTAASDDSVAPPPWVLKRAARIFDSERHRPQSVERIKHAIASLIFDSFARPATEGVRATGTANRQLLYRAGDYSIDLQVARPDRSQAGLIGQVLKQGDSAFESVRGLKLEIMRGDDSILSAVTDDLGEFKVSQIEEGVYNLRIELAEGTITVSDLTISES